jgi:hypothetical protein
MKNLAKKSLVAVGLMMSLSTLAGNTEVILNDKDSKVTNLSFENVKEGSTLTIKDLNGLVLYKEAIEQSGDYSKGFDLTTLPNGEYFFELNSELKIVVVPFNVKSNEVIFNKEREESIYKPLLIKKDQMVYVWKTEVDQSSLSYKIYYADNYDLVLSEKFEEMEEVSKVYDFSTAKKGNYVFVFETNGRRYTKTVKI